MGLDLQIVPEARSMTHLGGRGKICQAHIIPHSEVLATVERNPLHTLFFRIPLSLQKPTPKAPKGSTATLRKIVS